MVIGGRSGCGKSTLLEICAGLLPPKSGRIFWEGRNIAEFTQGERIAARQRIGYIFQKHALIHNFTIFDNVALPLRYHTDQSEREIRSAVRRLLEEVGLFGVDGKFPNELSSGQTKCAAIARSLIMNPNIVFADEPTSGVDPFTQSCIVNVIAQYRIEHQATVVMISNEAKTIENFNSPVKILENGKIVDRSVLQEQTQDAAPAIIPTFPEMP
jgi:ABC-type transporter Mla maintaining outer membrane lipid asymmetry ATPase subunit MlaF